MRAYWNSRYRPIACHVLSFRELRLVVDSIVAKNRPELGGVPYRWLHDMIRRELEVRHLDEYLYRSVVTARHSADCGSTISAARPVYPAYSMTLTRD